MITNKQKEQARIMTNSFIGWFPYLGIEDIEPEKIVEINMGMLFQVVPLHKQIIIKNRIQNNL